MARPFIGRPFVPLPVLLFAAATSLKGSKGASAEVLGTGPADVDGWGFCTETPEFPLLFAAALAADLCARLVMAVAARLMEEGMMLMDSLENPSSPPTVLPGDLGVLAAPGALFSFPLRGFFGVVLGNSMLPSDSPPNFCVAGRRH